MLRRAGEILVIDCLSCPTSLHDNDAHTMSSRILWRRCTTSTECKTIQIAASTIMDNWVGCTCLYQVFEMSEKEL
jgi:hypothetical protein